MSVAISNLWPTPVGVKQGGLSAESTNALVKLLLNLDERKHRVPTGGAAFKDFVDSGDFYHGIHYNLFDHDGLPDTDRRALIEFEGFACYTMREFLREGFAAPDWENVALSARCFGHIHRPGLRTFPHYHQASDLVLVHYLRVEDTPADREPLSLILLDPRGAPNYPWVGKMHTINPTRGTTVCHPSYLWHETNEWTGDSYRALIAVNFKVIGHGHETQFKPTRF
jgi:hypothetical protein